MRPPKAKMLSRNLVTALFFGLRGLVWWRASTNAYYCIILFYNTIPDSKRQQTTTVDNKHLFNGLVLTRFASLQRNTKTLQYGSKANRQQRNKRLRQR